MSEVKATMNAWGSTRDGESERARASLRTKTSERAARFCTHVGDHGEDGHPVEDLLPGADVACLGRHRASELSGELPGVHSDLDDVVDEGQQRRQREGGHEQRDEAKLDHCETEGR